MTKKLSGVVLDPEGKSIKPKKKKGEKPSERIIPHETEKCMNEVKEHLSDYCYDQYAWDTTVVSTNPAQKYVSIGGKQLDNKKYDDQEALERFYKKPFGPKRTLTQQEKDLKKEAKFFHLHADSRRHMLIFQRCREEEGFPICPDCKLFNKLNPLKPGFWEQLGVPRRSQGALFFVPEPDPNDPSHNKTLLQQVIHWVLHWFSNIESKGLGAEPGWQDILS